jgi:hypothetical protein
MPKKEKSCSQAELYETMGAFASNTFTRVLNEDQEKAIGLTKDRWLKSAFTKEAIDKKELKENVKMLYSSLDRSAPKKLIIAASPYEAVSIASSQGSLGMPLGKHIGDLVEGVYRNTCEYLDNAVKKKIWFVLAVLTKQKLDPVRHAVSSQFKAFGIAKEDPRRDNIVYASLWANRCAYHDYLRNALSIFYRKNLVPFEKLAQQSFLFLPYSKACIVSEKPEMELGEDWGLHSEERPALRFADGSGSWFLNGVFIPGRFSSRGARFWDQVSPEELLREDDRNVRYQLASRMDPKRICRELKSELREVRSNKDHALFALPGFSSETQDFYILRKCRAGRILARIVKTPMLPEAGTDISDYSL